MPESRSGYAPRPSKTPDSNDADLHFVRHKHRHQARNHLIMNGLRPCPIKGGILGLVRHRPRWNVTLCGDLQTRFTQDRRSHCFRPHAVVYIPTGTFFPDMAPFGQARSLGSPLS
jgi:hypothetical protein